MRRRTAMIMCAASAASVAAIAAVAAWPGSGISVMRAEGVTAMIAAEAPNLVMQASFADTLVVTEGGCMAASSSGNPIPVLFPYGSRLSDDGGHVVVPGFGSVRAGDAIEGGGGWVTSDDLPSECATDEQSDERRGYLAWQSMPD